MSSLDLHQQHLAIAPRIQVVRLAVSDTETGAILFTGRVVDPSA
jgi:hypothetical protein